MQIDFHHATTYVLARLAGFSRSEANTVAYSSQYVDDATSYGPIFFDNKALYQRVSSAHKMLDIRNTKALNNHQVWIPFHFLPGNGGKGMGKNPDGTFINKLVCKPNSPIAQQMIKNAILEKDKSYGLHRFGVVMHIYADTWAHQGFAGVLNQINEVENAKETSNSGLFDGGLKKFLFDILDDIIPPLGHGRANVLPDMPFLKWQYKDGHGQLINRDNTGQFCNACKAMFKAMKRYQTGDPTATVTDIPIADMKKLRSLFKNIKKKDGEERHKSWLKNIKNGEFSFGSETVKYYPRGSKSWKHTALGTSHDVEIYTYDKTFLKSNWKLFHDAIQAHLFYINHDLLPKYGICAA
jgi:hypothetical protein